MHTASPVRRAVILAAGNGDRFHNGSTHSKLLTPFRGIPLIVRTMLAAAQAGIIAMDVIVGYDAEAVREIIQRSAPRGVRLGIHYNQNWHEENGTSALVARPVVGTDRFALLMGDHIFHWRSLSQLLQTPAADADTLLAIDRENIHADRAREATKVRLNGDRITAIGKELQTFDALDMGLFVCSPRLFDSLEESRIGGDTSVSGGVRRLAAQGLMRGVDAGSRGWFDIDTVEDLTDAQQSLADDAARA